MRTNVGSVPVHFYCVVKCIHGALKVHAKSCHGCDIG